MYIDEKYTIGTDLTRVQQVQDALDDASTAAGLEVEPSKSVKATRAPTALLGHEFDGALGEYAAAPEKIRLTQIAGAELPARKWIKGIWIEWVLGHGLWCALLRRGTLAFLDRTFHFAQQNRNKLVRW